MKTKRLFVAAGIMLALNLSISIFLLIYLFAPPQKTGPSSPLEFEYSADSQYILYIGLNDKDTYEQIIPSESAKEIVNQLCVKYVGGYTQSEMEGGWLDENDVFTQENTLVYSISFAAEEDIIALMDEVLAALNQNSILVEKRGVASTFYNGGK